MSSLIDKENNFEFSDKPIQLVTIDQDGNFEITIEGSNLLNSLKNKYVSVASLTGPYRSGKSFLANLIMNQMSGFKTGSTINACTRGLWVWGKPFDVSEDTVLLIIDSEGLGSVEKDRELNIDLKIFTLCVLISSTLIYNSKHSISEDKIEELANAANLSNKIKLNKENTESISECFPKLIWALRDFSLDLNDLTANEYLEKALSISNSNSSDKNESREIIKRNFRERELITFVIPSSNTKMLKNLEYEQRENLRKEFFNAVDYLINKLKNEKRVKIIKGVKLDGIVMLGLLQNFIDSLNHNEVPVIMTSLESVLLSKANRLTDTYFDKFKEVFLLVDNKSLNDQGKLMVKKEKLILPVSSNQLIDNFFSSVLKIINDFSSSLPLTLSPSQVGQYIAKLQSRFNDEYFSLNDDNMDIINELIEEECNKIRVDILNNLNNEFKSENDNSAFQVSTTDELIKFSFSLTNNFNELFNSKLTNLPDSSFSKVLLRINKLYEETIFDIIRKVSRQLSDSVISQFNKLNEEITLLNNQNKKLKDTLNQEKKLLEERTKEKNELYLSKLDLETKFDINLRELRNKEKEFTNSLNIESQKYAKMEEYYLSLIKEKNTQLQEEEQKVRTITKELNLRDNLLTSKQLELNKEYSKLSLEIEKMKKQNETRGSSNEITSSNNDALIIKQLQSIFKNFQSLYMEFKESIEKCDKDKESLFRQKFFEISHKELDKKMNWLDDISIFRDNHLKNMQSIFDDKLISIRNDYNELRIKLDKTEFLLNEEKAISENLKIKLANQRMLLDEVQQISATKDSIIKIQKENIEVLEYKESEWKELKDQYEIKICEYLSDKRFKEDELETMILVIKYIILKDKKKYENHITRFDDSITNAIQNLVITHKHFNK